MSEELEVNRKKFFVEVGVSKLLKEFTDENGVTIEKVSVYPMVHTNHPENGQSFAVFIHLEKEQE